VCERAHVLQEGGERASERARERREREKKKGGGRRGGEKEREKGERERGSERERDLEHVSKVAMTSALLVREERHYGIIRLFRLV
jgi:hypothetical protein